MCVILPVTKIQGYLSLGAAKMVTIIVRLQMHIMDFKLIYKFELLLTITLEWHVCVNLLLA